MVTHDKGVCIECRERRARFRFRGRVKRDADHKLCFRCFRSLANAVAAVNIAARVPAYTFEYRESPFFICQALEQPLPNGHNLSPQVAA